MVLRTMHYLIPLYVLTACVIGFLLARAIIGPLRRLKQGTASIGKGNLTHRISEVGKDEFGDLAKDFNGMVEQLQATTVSKDVLEESEEKLRQTVIELRQEIAERERSEREREKLQVKLRHSETMSAMGSLVAGVAHEARNPLFGISSTLDAMEARFGAREEYGRYQKVLRGEVDRLSKLMRDLLEYGSPPAQQFSIGTVNDVISQAVQSCASLAERMGVGIDKHTDAGNPHIRLNRDRLAQVFLNLVENALQHAPRGSTVTVEVRRRDDNGEQWIDCSVKDSGPGFDPQNLPRVFDPFFTRRRGGTGLGLAIVQRIVEEHKGRIFAGNRPEGGARMTVSLPVAAATH
jgi:signal transduction histidine kinase